MKRKKYFTLIEVMLSLVLFGMLLSTLFCWYRHLKSSQQAMGKEKWTILEERFAYQQLENILPHANDSSCFFTTFDDVRVCEGPSLVFTFDYGVHQDPFLNNAVLGRLYIDKKSHSLCLGIWPHPLHHKTSPHRTLILLENVHDLSFDFYFPPNPFKKTVDPKLIGKKIPESGWQTEWLHDYGLLPPCIKIKMKRLVNEKTYDITLAFDLPFSSSHITFPKVIS